MHSLVEQYYCRASPPNACLSVDFLHLQPGDQAVVPVRFDKLTPDEDFGVSPLPKELAVVDATPGRCQGGVMEMSLCVEITDVVDVTLERGAVVASVEPIAALRSGGGSVEAKGKKWSALWGALVVALLLAGSASAPQRGLFSERVAAKANLRGSGAWCGSARARVEASSGRRASHPDPCLFGLQRVPRPHAASHA